MSKVKRPMWVCSLSYEHNRVEDHKKVVLAIEQRHGSHGMGQVSVKRSVCHRDDPEVSVGVRPEAVSHDHRVLCPMVMSSPRARATSGF